jgi:hypothetical protein
MGTYQPSSTALVAVYAAEAIMPSIAWMEGTFTIETALSRSCKTTQPG